MTSLLGIIEWTTKKGLKFLPREISYSKAKKKQLADQQDFYNADEMGLSNENGLLNTVVVTHLPTFSSSLQPPDWKCFFLFWHCIGQAAAWFD